MVMQVSVVVPVYRDATRARAAARALLDQHLPPEAVLEVILVDDGSADGTAEELRSLEPAVRVLALPHNQGRSGARNAGAAAARGSMVLFMDCDCLPADRNFLLVHISALASGAVASCGRVAGIGGSFWDRFQTDSSMRRERQHDINGGLSGTSSNLAVLHIEFEAIGGFDTGYRRYGFEDRDLLIRLAKRGSIAWTTATVRHQDSLCLTQVASKMAEAGQYSSRRFANHHPDAYKQLRYAAIDAQLHPAIKPLARLAAPLAMGMAHAFDRLGCERWLPYLFARRAVSLTSALAYFGGTARSG
jgi:glycosyltransferase involved in cell wall biosynthesis